MNNEEPDGLYKGWSEGHPELFGEWGKKEIGEGYFKEEEFEEEEESDLEVLIEDTQESILNELREKFPREFDFYEQTLDDDFFDILVKYETEPRQALKMLESIAEKWRGFAKNEVYERGMLNKKFIEGILDVLNVIYDFVEGEVEPEDS